MELLNYLVQIPLPFLVAIIIILAVITITVVYQWAKYKGIEGIRTRVYQLILSAEHIYTETSTGKQKMKWVVSQARKLLPNWLQVVLSEDALENIIEAWFRGVKDLLDDGKVNGSQKE